MKKTVFIGGPIMYLLQGDGFNAQFKKKLESVINHFEEKKWKVHSAHIAEQFGSLRYGSDEVIVGRDLGWLEEADVVIFLFPTDENGNVVRTDGTCIELGYAAASRKTTYVFWEEKLKDKYSPMFKGMSARKVKFFDMTKLFEVLSQFE